MKHKLVVAMSLLGLISAPAFADDTMAPHKHKHHKKHHHHHVAHHDYKANGGMPVQQAPMAESAAPMAMASASTVILDQMSQNTAMNKPMPEWFNRIGLSGGLNFDTGKWGSRSVSNYAYISSTGGAGNGAAYGASSGIAPNVGAKAGYTGENTSRFSINNAYLNVAADVNDWTKALMVISYTDTSLYYDQAYTSPLTNSNNGSLGATTGGLYGQSNFGSMNQKVNLEQAVVHFGNFDCSPFFADVGKQFIDFGRYTVHPITASMTQALTETLRNAIKLGFVTDMGIHGSVYTFQNGVYKNSDDNNMENTLNYGAALGYSHPDDQFGYDIGIGYMYNMLGVNDVSALTANLSNYAYYSPGGAVPASSGYGNRVASYAAYADLNFDAFTVEGRWVSAESHFSNPVIPGALNHPATGAKPWAAGVQVGYGFNALTRNQSVYLGYQASHDTVYFNLPHSRYVVGYGVDVLKNTRLSAEWDHDNAWNAAAGGPSGGNSNLISVRAAIKFG